MLNREQIEKRSAEIAQLEEDGRELQAALALIDLWREALLHLYHLPADWRANTRPMLRALIEAEPGRKIDDGIEEEAK